VNNQRNPSALLDFASEDVMGDPKLNPIVSDVLQIRTTLSLLLQNAIAPLRHAVVHAVTRGFHHR